MKIGIIGTGDMGKRYALEFARRGHDVLCYDAGRDTRLESELRGMHSGIRLATRGNEVSQTSDIIFYLVPTEKMKEAARDFGPMTKNGAIVSAGTSVMAPSVEAFAGHLPENVSIINWHWLFGPSIEEISKHSSIAVRVRSTAEDYETALKLFSSLGVKIIELPSYDAHDTAFADVQTVTHMAFLSMGTTWMRAGIYPWEDPYHTGGIDNIKIMAMLRILAGKSHVYSGIAIMNLHAGPQVEQYARSVDELTALMRNGDEEVFRHRIYEAKKHLSGNANGKRVLNDSIMLDYSLNSIPKDARKPNSHLSLLAMADAWHTLRINPGTNLVFATPVFKFRFGIVEYLFNNERLLEEAIATALSQTDTTSADLSFTQSARDWANIIREKDTEGYKRLFDELREFFKERIQVGMQISDELIKRLAAEGS